MAMENNDIHVENENPQWESYNRTIPAVPAPKPLLELGKEDAVFGVLAVVFCIFTAAYGVFGGFALGYLISCFLLTALFAGYFARRMKITLFPVLCGLLSVANAAVFLCTSNGSVRFFSAILCFLLMLVCFDGLLHGRAKGNRATLGAFITACGTIGNLEIVIKSLFTGGNGKKKTVGKVLIGLACAIPALVIIIPLLLSSDDAFHGMMNRIFSNTQKGVVKLLLGLILSVFAVTYGFSLKKGRIMKAKFGAFPTLENVYIISFLSAICGCYLLYLFSQLAYFFSAFSGFLPEGGITYAQYARKGFFEMCVIAVINLVIVFAALLLAKRNKGTACTGIKVLASFVAVFTLIIISTAISKMVLYIGAYGMTVLRLTTSAFMVFLAVVFISVILRIFCTKINIVKTGLITAGCILVILGTVNVNAVCAKYNYESYMTGRLASIDVEALYDWGDEGVPYLIKLVDHEDGEVAKEAKKYLAHACVYYYFENFSEEDVTEVSALKRMETEQGFERFSLPQKIAYDSLYDYLEKNPDFIRNYKDFLLDQ